MKPWIPCIIGMMVGSLVLIWITAFKPHDLSQESTENRENCFFIQKSIDIQK